MFTSLKKAFLGATVAASFCLSFVTTAKDFPAISVQLHSVKQDIADDFVGTITAIAEMGFDGVELAGRYGPYQNDPVGLKNFLAEKGLKISGAHIPFSIFKDEEVDAKLKFFQQMGVKVLIIPHEKRIDNPEQIDELIKELNAASILTESYGMQLGYHNHSKEFKAFKGETFWDYLAKNTRKSFALQLDVGWVNYAGHSPYDFVKRYPGRTVTSHYKIRTYKGKPSFVESDKNVLIGQDDFDWKKLAETMAKHGGTDWIVVEQEEYPKGKTRLEAVKGSFEGLKAALAR